MPHYDYVCEACGHQLELYQSIKDKPKRKCPECSKQKLRRLIGGGGGLVFKGSGFYITDYRGESGSKKSDSTESKPSDSGTKSSKPGADTKPKETKSQDSGSTS